MTGVETSAGSGVEATGAETSSGSGAVEPSVETGAGVGRAGVETGLAGATSTKKAAGQTEPLRLKRRLG